MRCINLISGLTSFGLTLVSAAAPPSTVDFSAPATQSNGSILILPFSPPADQLYQWVGPAIQHVVAADVSHGSRVLNVLAPASAQATGDADAALAAGKN